MIKAILSSTVLTMDGTYKVSSLSGQEAAEAIASAAKNGVTHFVGHPSTKILLDAAGVKQDQNKVFVGLKTGESFIAVPLAVNPREGHVTSDQAISAWSEVIVKVVTRIS